MKNIKQIIYSKNLNELDNISVSKSNSLEEIILYYFFKEFYKNSNFDLNSRVHLESFSENVIKMLIFKENFFDSSIYNLFPKCTTHSIQNDDHDNSDDYISYLLCEKFNHEKVKLIRNYVYKRLKRFQRYLITQKDYDKIDKSNHIVINNDLINKIWEENPSNETELSKILSNDKYHKKYSKSLNVSYYDTILSIINKSQSKDYSNYLKFWERGAICVDPSKCDVKNSSNYESYNFTEWLNHFNLCYINPHSKKLVAKRDLHSKIAGMLNRYFEIEPRLKCYNCSFRLVPNFKYGKHSMGSYRLTVFNCNNSACSLFNKGIYINHCFGFLCWNIIDSRENLKRCANNRYICNSCLSCCTVEHNYHHLVGSCNKCKKSELVLVKSSNPLTVKCFNRNCNEIFDDSVYNLERFKNLNYKDTFNLMLLNRKKYKS